MTGGHTPIAWLEEVRRVTLKHLRGLDDAAVDWLARPTAKSIGEIVLHTAGFEYLAIAAVRRSMGLAWPASMWADLAGGFAREAGFAPPRGVSRDALIERLDAVRAFTRHHLGEHRGSLWISDLARASRGLVHDLAVEGPAGDYHKLVEAQARSVVADGPTDAEGRTDLIGLLTHHETYHRGHLTYTAYLFAGHGIHGRA